MIFYFYKTKNTINNKFYYGVHKTNNMNDGYMGSGTALKKAIKKYGSENFEKEVLMFFNNEEEMYNYEHAFITEDLVKNKNCYNLIIGGKCISSCKSMTNRKKSVYENNPKFKEEVYKKVGVSLKKYWSEGNIEKKKKDRGESVKNSEKYREGIQKVIESKQLKGYNNPDFCKRWIHVYEKHEDLIIELLKYSNLPSCFIVYNLFNLKVKEFRLVKYFEETNKLPKPLYSNIEKRFLRLQNEDGKGHKDGGSKKSIYSNDIKYNFMFLFEDFIIQFNKIKDLLTESSISDSMILQGSKKYDIQNYYQVIEYMEKIGYITNVRKEDIRVLRIIKGKKPFTVPAKKTMFDITNKVNCILVDKEFNTYGIDDNGRPFQKGRFRLQANGKEYSLRCKQ